jgi:fatty acid amide hydrolase 2
VAVLGHSPVRDCEPELLHGSAVDLAARVRSRAISPIDLVEAHIARIMAVNPVINAVVAERFEAARAEARAAEIEADSGMTKPLLGVPFTVKEMVSLDGMPHTFGSLPRRGRRADADATVVQRLRAAGAIPLGVTNVPEWGMWFETYNDIYGVTNNPHDPARIAGGSSGGEGAIVGAGGSVFGIGTDIGGSVRMPAAFCGVFGHKPSNGMLPLTGVYPVYASGPDAVPNVRASHLTIGTLTRSARDIAPLLRIMSGPDGVDAEAQRMELRSNHDMSWDGRRVIVLEDAVIATARAASADVRASVRRAAEMLSRRGAAVQDGPRDIFSRAGDMWFAALQSMGGPTFRELLGGGAPIGLLREMMRTAARRGTYSWTSLLFAIGEKVGRRSEARVRRAISATTELNARLRTLLGDGGILLMPTHPRTAPRHNAPVLRPFDFLYTAIFNALRAPATSAPFGFDADGLPLAVQIASVHGNDHLTIAAACTLEDELPAWRPARVPGVEPTAA